MRELASFAPKVRFPGRRPTLNGPLRMPDAADSVPSDWVRPRGFATLPTSARPPSIGFVRADFGSFRGRAVAFDTCSFVDHVEGGRRDADDPS